MSFEKLKDYVETISGRELIQDIKVDHCDLHFQYVNPTYLPEVAHFQKYTHLGNKRKKDLAFAEFELINGSLNSGQWGLTEPNVEAYYKNLAKFNKNSYVDYDKEAFKFAEDCLEQHFFLYLRDCGIEDTKTSLKRLDLSKSPGPPWNILFKTKKELMDYILFHEYVEKGWDWLLEADRVWLTGTALKEEVRPKEKLDLNKIRAFTPQSADLNVLTNRLCGEFNDKFTDCNLKTHSCVGISPFKGGWNRLFNKLNDPDKPYAFEGDYSDYDSSLGIYLMMMVCRFRFKCLATEYQTYDNWCRLCNLYRNIIWSNMVLIDGTIVVKPGGNPSGSANTVVDNTLIAYFVLAYSWYRLCPKQDRNYGSFNKNVIVALYGDDNTGVVTHHASTFFTPVNLTKVAAEMGMTLNFENQEFVTIHDVCFLQADFNSSIYGTVIYHVDPDKSFEAIKWSEHFKNKAMSLQRACGMRLVTWSDMKARKYYDDYIKYLMKKHDTLLAGSKEWEDAKCAYKTDWQMASLYAGFENKDQKDFQTANVSKNIDIEQLCGESCECLDGCCELATCGTCVLFNKQSKTTKCDMCGLGFNFCQCSDNYGEEVPLSPLPEKNYATIFNEGKEQYVPVIIEDINSPCCPICSHEWAYCRCCYVEFKSQSRGINELNRLIGTGQITKSGVDWMIQSVDTFSDVDKKAVGYPDLSTTKSVVQLVTSTCTIRAPSIVGPNSYDALFIFNPCSPDLAYDVTEGNDFIGTEVANNYPETNVVNSKMCSGWNCFTGVTNFEIEPATFSGGTELSSACAYPRFVALEAPSRLASTGIEIYNVTAELYKQGSLTCCNAPANPIETYYNSGDPILKEDKGKGSGIKSGAPLAARVSYTLPCSTIIAPPIQTPDIQLFPGSLTWDAAEGIYMNARLNNEINPYVVPIAHNAGVVFDRPDVNGYDGNCSGYFSKAVAFQNSIDASLSSATVLPYDWSVIRFSGLSNQTVLTMTTRYYIESAPANYSKMLAPLMQPAAEYSSKTFDIYSQSLKSMPCACKVNENPLGEWISGALKVISTIAVPAGAAIGTILGGPAGGVAGASVGRMISGYANEFQKTPGMKKARTQLKARIKNENMRIRNPGSDGNEMARIPKRVRSKPVKKKNITKKIKKDKQKLRKDQFEKNMYSSYGPAKARY